MDFEVEFLYSKFLQSNGVSIDTRTLQPDNLFFGLRGEHFNGAVYAEKALEKGASYTVIDDPAYKISEKCLVVEDALKALQGLAMFHRSRYKRKLLALTGSNGKTTTKELINAVLSQKYITHATSGNYNNHIGVPLTLLHIHPQVEIAIIEMGANAVGEIKQLSEFARPTHGLITNIGKAHIEGFGGVEGIIRGKSELYDFLLKNGGEVFINTNDPVLKRMAHRFENPYLLPEEDSYFPCKLIAAEPFVVYETEDGEIVETQLSGKYNFNNIAYALAIGKYFDVLPQLANQAIRDYSPNNNRSQVINLDGATVFMDAYNANPDSMKGAIENLAQTKGKKLAILGDMLELGDTTEEEHQAIGRLLMDNKIDEAYLVGPYMKAALLPGLNARHFPTKADLEAFLTENRLLVKNILIKASRKLSLETIQPKLNIEK